MLNDEWVDPEEFYRTFVAELNGILILMGLPPVNDELPPDDDEMVIIEEKEEKLDEFGEPVVRSSNRYQLSRSEKLKQMKICL